MHLHWLPNYYRRFDGKSKFRQDGSYKPKQKSQFKTDWRDKKQFQKDQSKNTCWCKLGPYLKNLDHRARRRYEREMIASEKWDEMFHHTEMFISSWDAC